MIDSLTKNKDKGRRTGHLFVVSAPSGAGKTTLCDAVRKHLPQLVYSVSSTTRSPREGEREGIDYFFVTVEAFEKGINAGQWVEWAKVYDNYYGTSVWFIEDQLKEGRDVLLDIDVQGAGQIVQRYPDAITIFIMAPSLDTLRRRLNERGLDSANVIGKRMCNAENEIACRPMYRYTVVNDHLKTAITHFVSILKGEAK